MKKQNGGHGISCSVGSCRFNEDCKECMLESITVSPCPGCSNGDPRGESMCNSYKKR